MLVHICIDALAVMITGVSGSYRYCRITPIEQLLGKLVLVWAAMGIIATIADLFIYFPMTTIQGCGLA